MSIEFLRATGRRQKMRRGASLKGLALFFYPHSGHRIPPGGRMPALIWVNKSKLAETIYLEIS
jgi:hypothetical protein